MEGKALACSTSFASTSGMIEKLFSGKKVERKPYYQKMGLAVDRQWMLVVGIIIGSLISALLSGDFRWQWVPSLWAAAFGGNPFLLIPVATLIFLVLYWLEWAGL
jgi:hypothetical protein